VVSNMKCFEDPSEAARISHEPFRKLRVNIDEKVNFMIEGIKKDLEGDIETRSVNLNRTALYKKVSQISRLPRNLIVQYVRFFWKKDVNKKAKILRKVEFPMKFDITDLCEPKLKRSLLAARRQLKEEEDAKLGLSSLDKSKNAAFKSIAAAKDKTKEKGKDEKGKEKEKEKDKMEVEATSSSSSEDSSSLVDLQPVTSSGYYELSALISHQGRFADSGHYVGWSRKKGDDWLKFDDDKVSPVTAEEIKALSGGGDWPMVYLLFYRRVDDFVGKTFATSNANTNTTTTTSSSSDLAPTDIDSSSST